MKKTGSRIGLLAALAAAATACGHGVAPGTLPTPGIYALRVNGSTMNVPTGYTVLDAVRATPTAGTIQARSAVSGEPLYLVDGVRIHDGPAMLRALRVCEVESIELLRPLDAFARYGVQAGAGAIVVRTRRADTPSGGC